MIRGPKGTTVVVTIKREGSAEPIDFKIVRDVIPIESVRSMVLKPGYGYIWITNFRDKTTQDLIEAFEELESGGTPLKGLVLDLRDNPGGLLDQAIQVSDLFLGSGTILTIKGRLEKHTKMFEAHADETDRDYPMIVLINGGSASASEIVAGALQDHKRALVLGTTSFGKGSVQTVETLRESYGLKLTIARYYTPSGRSIQAKGIEPDIVVKRRFIDEDEDAFDEGLLKEKDLKDHLEEEPLEGKEDKEDKSEPQEPKGGKKKSKKRNVRFRHGPPTLENLQKDHQVMRALEILLSYEIFKGTKR
jgi:carboxyl-terminal processing protease